MYIVITGASRGIGLELTRLALDKGHEVAAVVRNPKDSPELTELKVKFSKLNICEVDLLEDNAALKISECVQSFPMLDVVINNAGVYLDDTSIKNFQDSFLVNAIKPLFITKELLGPLKKSTRPLSLQITSQMGSLEDNHSGGSYSYRASKSALNMFFKSLSIDEPWLISLLVHPGWVKTRMGGSGAPLSVEDSARGIWKLVEKASIKDTGTFLNYQGNEIAW